MSISTKTIPGPENSPEVSIRIYQPKEKVINRDFYG